MKNILISILISPFSLHAMELNSGTIPQNAAHKAMTKLHHMTQKELTQLTKELKSNFDTLKTEKIIDLPFDTHQAEILVYSYKVDAPEITGVRWDLGYQLSPQPYSCLNFFQLLQLYIDLHKAVRPDQAEATTAIGTSGYLGLAYDYAANISLQRSYTLTSTSDVTRPMVKRIETHFPQVQSALSNLPELTLWTWLKMRYHMNKTAQAFSSSSHTSAPLFYQPVRCLDFLSYDYQENKDLLKRMETQVSALINDLDIPLPRMNTPQEPQGEGMPWKYYREILKVLFSEVPYLGNLDSKKEIQGFNEFFTFAQLYLDLTSNYKKKPSLPGQAREDYDLSKLSSLLTTLNGNAMTEEDAALIVREEKGRHFLEELFKVFSNPFAPTIKEINSFCYTVDHILLLCQKAKRDENKGIEVHALTPSKSENSNVNQDFWDGVSSDLKEVYQDVSNLKHLFWG